MTDEEGQSLKCNTTTLGYTLERVNGATYAFSAATADANRFCRLESVQEISGYTLTLSYSGAVGTGKLTKGSSPSGTANICCCRMRTTSSPKGK